MQNRVISRQPNGGFMKALLAAVAVLPSADALAVPSVRMGSGTGALADVRLAHAGRAPMLVRRVRPAAGIAFGSMLWRSPPALAAAAAADLGPPTALRTAGRVAKVLAALGSAWYGVALKNAGPAANPERQRAGQPIRCPWPFLLVALPWTELGRRSLRAGFCDWQTWVVIALLLLRVPLPAGW